MTFPLNRRLRPLASLNDERQPWLPAPELGIGVKDLARFSFTNAIRAMVFPNDSAAQRAAGLEREISEAASKAYGVQPRGFFIPSEVLSYRDPDARARGKRDLVVGTDTAGGHTVATDLLASSFIDLLRNRAAMLRVGTLLTGLRGNVDIPKLSGSATAYWLAENEDTTESQQTFSQVQMTPHTVAAMTDLSRRIILQSSLDIEGLVRSDLALVLGLEIDRVAINGTGSSGEPTGILNTSGIGDVAGGLNGAAPDWADIVNLESQVAIDNADVGTLYYATNSRVRSKLKVTEKASGTAAFVWPDSEMVNGYQALVTNQVPHDLDKGTSTGVCSAILFGNFADLLIGMWGGLDLVVDTATFSARGALRLVMFQDLDIAVRHPESFAAMQDALTA